MKTSWVQATLQLLFLIGSALPEKQDKDNNPEILRVKVNDDAAVLCPSFTTEEMSFNLHNDNQTYRITRNMSFARHQPNMNAALTITHQLNPENNSTKFVLHNVTKNQTGLYCCTAIKLFPPPLELIKEEPQTIVIVDDMPPEQCETLVSHLPLWVGLGVLSIYGLIITSAAFLFRSRLTKVDLNQHDYINTRPRARRGNKVLHPTRSWYCDNTANIVTCKPPSIQMPK